jgi:hypothetical protein
MLVALAERRWLRRRQQITDIDTKGAGKSLNIVERHVALSTLD